MAENGAAAFDDHPRPDELALRRKMFSLPRAAKHGVEPDSQHYQDYQDCRWKRKIAPSHLSRVKARSTRSERYLPAPIGSTHLKALFMLIKSQTWFDRPGATRRR
jgi:hypothetical protein